MNNIQQLIEGNSNYLYGLDSIIKHLSDEEYQKQIDSFQSIGAHVRHIVEHYEQFLIGIKTGAVNYDKRLRSRLCETSRQCAMKKIKAIKESLISIGDKDPNCSLTLTACTDGYTSQIANGITTSLSRELLFVQQHAIHHSAQIALLCSICGKNFIDASFYLAPATVQYNRRGQQEEKLPA